MLLCKCDCGNEKIVYAGNLRNGSTISCGCHKQSGDANRILNYEQLLDIITELTNNLLDKPFIDDIANYCNLHEETIRRYIKKWNLYNYINTSYRSRYEREITKFIEDIPNITLVINSRNIITPYELDIYIPEKKLAIEFNGYYWHSEIYKDKYYHQEKTIECAKKGIQLIHIFEYEWKESSTQNKIKELLRAKLSSNKNIIFAKNTNIKQIDNNICQNFLNSYHIQNDYTSKIRIGCYYNNELIGVMTFGKPKFNTNYEYELHRFCWHPDFIVVGGAEKLFKYFLKNYSPTSIITYIDISKFNGNRYIKLGFKPIQPNPITEPNYIWVSQKNNHTITKNNTQKHRLIELGLGDNKQSEDEIMYNLGYYKIYDSGNIKLEWRQT